MCTPLPGSSSKWLLLAAFWVLSWASASLSVCPRLGAKAAGRSACDSHLQGPLCPSEQTPSPEGQGLTPWRVAWESGPPSSLSLSTLPS